MNKVAGYASALLCFLAAAPATAGPAVEAGCDRARPADGSQSPSTASAVRLVQEWLHAINTADDAAYVRFLQDRGPVLPFDPKQWLDFRNQLRGVQYCG